MRMNSAKEGNAVPIRSNVGSWLVPPVVVPVLLGLLIVAVGFVQ
jgi:hypothetical protein